MRFLSVLLVVSFCSFSAFADNSEDYNKYLDCIDYGHQPMTPEKLEKCGVYVKKEKPVSKEVKAALLKSALANAAVSAVLKQSATEASLLTKSCLVEVVSISGVDSKAKGQSLDGTITLKQSCVNSKIEFALFTTITVQVYGGQGYLETVKVDRAG